MSQLTKINFENKESSVITNSLYILNAENINEIKDVVNNLIDYFEETDFKFNDVFKFIAISVPKFFINGSYELVLELSYNNSFTVIKKITTKLNKEQFYIFNDGKFENFKNLDDKDFVDSSDLEKLVLININENLKDKKYFGRYYFKLNDKIVSDYYGVSFGNNEFTINEIKFSETFSIVKDDNLTNENLKSKQQFENIVNLVGNNEIILNTYLNDLSKDVTGFTEYYFDSKYNNIIEKNKNKFIINDNISNESIKISAVTLYNYEIFYSSINLLIINKNEKNNFDIKFYIDENIDSKLKLASNEEKIFDIKVSSNYFNTKTTTKYSENPDLFNIKYDENIIEIKNNRIIAKNVNENTFTKVTVDYIHNGRLLSKEFPICIESTISSYSLIAELSNTIFSSDSLNNEYKIYLVDLNTNEKKDVTLNTNVIFLNDEEKQLEANGIIFNKVEFNALYKIFNVTNILNDFDLNILFKYTDPVTNNTFKCYKTIYASGPVNLQNLVLDFPKIVYMENEYDYSVKAKFENDENLHEITNVCEIIADDSLIIKDGKISFDNEYRCGIDDSKLFLVTVKYKFNNKIYEKDTTITVKKREITGIIIEWGDKGDEPKYLHCGKTSGQYSVKLKYADQDELIDISESPFLNLYLTDTSLAVLDKSTRKISTSILHKGFNIILNAEYSPNNCNNEIYYATKNIHVLPFFLTHTEIFGDNEIESNKSKDYYTNAYYSNGDIHDHVNASYLILDENKLAYPENSYCPVTTSYDDETNIITIRAKKCLNDLKIVLSSYYEEEGYEEFEFYSQLKEITILGGFKVNLFGTLLTYDEENDKIKYNNFSSLSALFIKDITKDDDEMIKEFNWDQTELLKAFLQPTVIAPNEFIKTNNYQVAHIFKKIGNDNWQKIKTIDINTKFSFDIAEYKIVYDTISNIDGAIFSTNNFDIELEFDNSYILGLSGLYFENGFQVMNPIAIFETSTGYQFSQSFIYNKTNDIWLLNNVPQKASKLKNISVYYAFTEKDI